MAADRATETKGFAGLQSMVSVETEMPASSESQPEHLDEGRDRTPAPITQPSQATTGPSPRGVAVGGPSGERSGHSAGKTWAWIIGIVVVLIWLANIGDQKNTSPTPTSPAAPSAPVSPAQPSIESDAGERQPEAGDGLVLSTPELRYCVSESIRIDGMRAGINEYSQSSLDLFNQAVSDYNSRCAHFRYRRGTLEAVQSEIEPRRAALQRQGLDRMRASASEETRPSSAPTQESAGSAVTPDAQPSEAQSQRRIASRRPPPTPSAVTQAPNPPFQTAPTSSGKTYHMANIWDAVRAGSPADVTAMLTDGRDVNLREKGTTLLIEATRMSNYATMEFLLQNGADPNSRNGDSRSALDFARDRKDDRAISILQRFGAT